MRSCAASLGRSISIRMASLNRAKVAQLVFTDPEARQRLNDIVHPRVARELQERLKELEQQGAALVMVEVPLLFEAGLEAAYDRVIVVYVDPEDQIRRLRSGTAAGPQRSPEYFRPSGPWVTRRPGPMTWWTTGAHWLRPGSGSGKSGPNCKKSANHLDRRA